MSLLHRPPPKNLWLQLVLSGMLSLSPAHAADYPGLPTREQNPLLQGYFIPAMPVAASEGWALSQSLYITNTYQREQTTDEALVIDVENTRLDLQASWARDRWRFNINLPLLRNSGGFLDQTIVGWHDFFGLPQGGREQAQNDQIWLFYQNADGVVTDSTETNSGIGDLQLAAGYQLGDSSQFWFGMEFPVSSSTLISNHATDYALWFSHVAQGGDTVSSYGLLGLSFPADRGALEGLLRQQFLFGQLGILYRLRPAYQLIVQADFHSAMIDGSKLDALGNSLQAQFALRLPRLSRHFRLELFFSEDILPGHAPDITFGMRLSPHPRAH